MHAQLGYSKENQKYFHGISHFHLLKIVTMIMITLDWIWIPAGRTSYAFPIQLPFLQPLSKCTLQLIYFVFPLLLQPSSNSNPMPHIPASPSQRTQVLCVCLSFSMELKATYMDFLDCLSFRHWPDPKQFSVADFHKRRTLPQLPMPWSPPSSTIMQSTLGCLCRRSRNYKQSQMPLHIC